MDWAKTTARRDEKHYVLGLGVSYIRELMVLFIFIHNQTRSSLVPGENMYWPGCVRADSRFAPSQ